MSVLTAAALAPLASAAASPVAADSVSGPVARTATVTATGAATGTATSGLPSPVVAAARPDVNPANPNCNPPPDTSFSGGTGAFFSNSFKSNYVWAPLFGPQDVPDGNFTNIFLYPNSATMTWDQYQASLPVAERGPTTEQIDAMTQALVCSSYFDDLTQYNINPPEYSGDENTVPACVNAALHDAMSTDNIISYATLRTFAGCEQSHNSNNSPQVNIFSATGIEISNYGQDGTDMCSPGTDGSGGTGGYHGWGIGVPNFTVVPTNPVCNSSPGAVLDSLSHEMVELVADPGGLGWLHVGDVTRPWEDYDQGELADICSSVGLYPAPAGSPGFIPFPDTSALTGLGLSNLGVAPYWSDQDNRCEPTSIMNDTLVPLAGSPSIEFTGSVHNLVVPISQPSPPAGVLDSLELDVVTGADNLNASSDANVIVQADLGGAPVDVVDDGVNEGAEWAANSLHAVYLDFPPGIPVGDITQVTLNTEFSGGLFGDNWDVAGLMVQADVTSGGGACTPTSAQLLDVTGTDTLGDGSTGLVRMAGGSTQTFTETLSTVPVAQRNLLVNGLFLTVGTGDDDLRGGNAVGDNANAVIDLTPSGSVHFSDINQDANWPRFTPSPQVSLLNLNSLPPGTTAGQLASLQLQTGLPGGLFGDDWDVATLQLFAVLGCARTTVPHFAEQTVVNVVGTTTLADGSTGLCRETGSVHDCSVPIPPPAGLAGTDVVDSLDMSISTGSDDLRGGGFAGDNANVTVAGLPTFLNVNQSEDWPDNTGHFFPLAPLPSTPVTLSSLTSVDVSTMFPGGFDGDNWDISAIKLNVTVTVPSASPRRPPLQAPASTARAVPGAVGLAASSPASAPASFCGRSPVPSVGCGAVRRTAPLVTPPSPWLVAPTASEGPGDSQINAMTCATPAECFAVGFTDASGGTPQALIETGNGSAWTPMTGANTLSQYSQLNSVSCLNPSLCFAVGLSGSGGVEGAGGLAQTLIEQWNGTKWSVAAAVNVQGAVVSVLNGVSCTPTTCEAVGYQETSGAAQTLIEKYQGGDWSMSPGANPPTGYSELNGVSCTGPTTCVAVGDNDGSGVAHTLVEQWNGVGWSIVASANAGGGGNVFYGMGDNVLLGVSCYSGTNCVAVGEDVNESRAPQTLVETSGVAGKPWTLATSPDPLADDVLSAVSCTSATDCVATGAAYDGDTSQTLIEDWYGSAWSVATAPPSGLAANVLTSVWCTTPISCIAGGSDGNGSGDNQLLALDYVPTPPQAPRSVSATGGPAKATVTFSPPSYDGGSPVTGYVVTATDVTSAVRGGQTASGTTSPITVTGLTNGDIYTFTVTAANLVGTGPPSSASNRVSPDTVPSSPTGVTAVPGEMKATVSWHTPTAPGGRPITGYQATAADATNPANGGQTCTTVTHSCTVTGLTDGDSYTFTVTATNVVGTGPPSTPSPAVTPGGPPGAPTAVSATPGPGLANVSFTAPADDGGSPVTSYTVTATDTTTPANGGQTASGGASPITVNGLTNGDSYTFTVTAKNAVATGPASLPSSAVVPLPPG